MIDAKLKGEGIDQDAVPEAPTTTNVIDLMAALKRSVAASEEQPASEKSAEPAKTSSPKTAPAAKAPGKRAS